MKKYLKDKLKFFFLSVKEKIEIFRLKRSEIKKFKDYRRKKIFSTIHLSSEQKKQIDSLYNENYGSRVPYIWHRHYTAFTGNFDANYFPELLYIPEFEYYMNLKRNYKMLLSDKNILQYLATEAKIKMPKTIYSCVEGIYKDSENNLISEKKMFKEISNLGECFFKPTVDTCSGVGCLVLNIQNGVDIKTGKGCAKILEISKKNWAIQERLCCHESIRKIFSNSVNTFRIITYRWKNDIISMPAVMRIGRGNATVDNAHAGGIFIAVNDDGFLHKTAFTEFRDEFSMHPDTGIIFEGYKIDNFAQVVNAAKKCHFLIPQIGCVNWDFTIDEYGNPVLIEANVLFGGIWIIQMAHGKGAFGSNTENVLKWLNRIKHASISERDKYMFGNIPDC